MITQEKLRLQQEQLMVSLYLSLQALELRHSAHSTHSDLKPSKVFVSELSQLKL